MVARIQVEAPVAPKGADKESLVIDLGSLTAFDPSPCDEAAYRKDPVAAMLASARDVAQTLVEEVFSLPVTIDKNIGPLAKLPAPSTPIPREKPLPKGKPETKWAKFAREKGIVKKNKSKLVWDEGSNSWKRRHGYKSVKDEMDTIVVNAKPGDGPDHDPFLEAQKAKKERVNKNKKQQEKNMQRGREVAPSLALAATLPFEGSRTGEKGKKLDKSLKADAKVIKDVAALSTASVGKFDKRLKGEKSGAPKGKQRTRLPVTDPAREKAHMDTAVNRVLKREADSIVNMEKAVANYITDDQQERARKKQKTQPKAKGGKVAKGGLAKGGPKGGKGGKR